MRSPKLWEDGGRNDFLVTPSKKRNICEIKEDVCKINVLHISMNISPVTSVEVYSHIIVLLCF